MKMLFIFFNYLIYSFKTKLEDTKVEEAKWETYQNILQVFNEQEKRKISQSKAVGLCFGVLNS